MRYHRTIWLILSLALFAHLTRAEIAKTQTASTPAAAIAEMDSLLTQAEQALRNPDSLEGFLYVTSVIGARLDTFEMRFGSRPSEASGWKDLSSHAFKVFQMADGKHSNDVYFNADSAKTGLCVLLELAGKSSKALRRLEDIKPGGGCGNWMASVMLAVNQQKSGIHQRMGNYKLALEDMNAAMQSAELALGFPAPELVYSRYAFLLGKNGEERKAIETYQRVVDLYPGSIGDELARKALSQKKALIEPTSARILSVYLEHGRNMDFDAAIFALGAHRFSDSYDVLNKMLDTAEGWKKNRIIPALGFTGDERAIPRLQSIVAKGDDAANSMHALRALGRLGDSSQVLPYLHRRQNGNDAMGFMMDEWVDRTLREIYNGGPGQELRMGGQLDSASWIKWIEQRASKSS